MDGKTVPKNLNKTLLRTDDKSRVPICSVRGQNVGSESLNVECFFQNLEDKIVSTIEKYQDENSIIFGCVAWLTNTKILNALKDCHAVQIIVQKEDFLRPDYGYEDDFKQRLRSLYSELKLPYPRAAFKSPMGMMDYLSSPDFEAVRCCGNHNSDKRAATPRCHHKFLAFCRIDDNTFPLIYTVEKVWTGSFNLTHNSTNSLENAVLLSLKDKEGHSTLLQQFQREHHAIFAISEPLDWTSDWVEPEYRIGT